MKNFNWLMMLMTAAMLSFVACEEPTPTPPVDEPTETSFDVTIDNVTKTSMTFTVIPEDLEAEYFCMVYDVEAADQFTKDEYLVATIYQEITEEAGTMGKTFVEYMPELVDKGIVDEGLFTGLTPDTDYYLLVFGVDPANEYAANTELVKTQFTTPAATMSECTFEVTTNVVFNSVEFNVVPSIKDQIWHLFTVPVGMWEQYVESEEGPQMSPETFYITYFNDEVAQYRDAGYTDEQISAAILLTGDKTLMAKGLTANAEYMYVIAGLNSDESGIWVATDIFTGKYTTGEAAKSDMTFEISVTDIEAMRAAIKVVPSEGDETFCWMCGAWDGKKTAEDIMNEIVALYGSWMNNGAMLYRGVQDYTGGPGSAYKYKLDAPDTDYYVVAFGYAGGVTTAPEMVTFRTLPGADPMEVEFSMKATNTTPYSTDIAITVSDSSVYYSGGAMAPEAFNEEVLIEEFNANFDFVLEESRKMDPNTTIAQILGTYYWTGSQNLLATGLYPDTELMGFVVALDIKTGHIARVITFPDLARTPAVGSVTPSIELVGYYSGDEEAGSVFGQPEATKGKAITVVKYGDIDGARSLFTTMVGDDCTNLTSFPDTDLWELAMPYWNSCKVATPYSFYTADWEYGQTALAYAKDSTGTPGGIARLYTMPTADNKGEIADLKALYDSLSTKSVALPVSVVVGEPKVKAEPTITNVTPVKMAAPAAVETELSVEQPRAEIPSMLQLDFVRSFHLRK